MTQLVSAVHIDIVDAAFAKVVLAAPVAVRRDGKLYKDLSGPVVAAATEIWERIRELLNHAARKGWDVAQQMLDDVNIHITALAEELKEHAHEFRALLLERLQDLMRETFDLVLRSVRSRIQIGEATYILGSVQLESKLVYTSSIEASVTALCKFVGQGETVVKGTYTLMNSPATS